MLKYVAVLLLGVSSNAWADVSDWDKTSKNLWYGYLALNVVDAVQTLDFYSLSKAFFQKSAVIYMKQIRSLDAILQEERLLLLK